MISLAARDVDEAGAVPLVLVVEVGAFLLLDCSSCCGVWPTVLDACCCSCLLAAPSCAKVCAPAGVVLVEEGAEAGVAAPCFSVLLLFDELAFKIEPEYFSLARSRTDNGP